MPRCGVLNATAVDDCAHILWHALLIEFDHHELKANYLKANYLKANRYGVCTSVTAVLRPTSQQY